tara:strand:- start:795 stop:2033 length:1239 start_codon:yes stop_codon:yes gene_type:complete
MFRQLILDNASSTEAECRQTIRGRIGTCKEGVCPQCISSCNYAVARTLSSIVKCSSMHRHAGFVYNTQVTDAGQLARSMHGAVRKTGFKAVPERLHSHLYYIAHDNPNGYVQRDSISCRKHHRTSPAAHFAPGFDEEGNPIARSGYMQPCAKDSDCLPCGRHPLTDSFYKCQRIYKLYDTVVTGDDGEIVFVNTTGGSSSSFDIDLEAAHVTGKNSICVDYDSSMNQGCTNEVGAKIKDSLTGCFDGPVGKLLCGLSLEIKHGDLSTVETTGNLFYPRVLLAGGQDHDGDGVSDPEMTCLDPIGARTDCTPLSRTTSIADTPLSLSCPQIAPKSASTWSARRGTGREHLPRVHFATKCVQATCSAQSPTSPRPSGKTSSQWSEWWRPALEIMVRLLAHSLTSHSNAHTFCVH